MKSKYILSIVVPTLNSGSIIADFLTLIKEQKFPKNKVEILIIDGGSKDNTISIAKKFGAKILKNPKIMADIGVSLGMQYAKGELIMILATDNYLEDPLSLKKITDVFKDKEIMGAFPMQGSNFSDTIYTKYINTFTDPFNHFIYQDAANSRTFHKVYKLLKHSSTYDVFDYSNSNTPPLIAFAQGFTVRTSFVKQRKHKFDDLMPVMQLIQERKKIAYVYSVTLYHHTVKGLTAFIKKQMWATNNFIQKKNYGMNYRKDYLSPSQKFRIKIWPLYAFSMVLPICRSLYGVVVDREILWLLHPSMCFISASASGWAVIRNLLGKHTIQRY